MQFVRIYADKEGRSHFEDIEVSFESDPRTEKSPFQAATGVVLHRAPAGRVIDWHTAPRRQYVVTLSGEWEIECGDGTVRRFRPGDVMLAEDQTGNGHISRVVGSEPHVFMTVHL
ncbi:MAG: hypothetical protein ACE5JU_12570 [Candidatus Binatia bacterium]